MRSNPALRACALLSAVFLANCGEPAEVESPQPESLQQQLVIPERALAVTDFKILQAFPFFRVMKQITDTSGLTTADPKDLFQQWWDTQNTGPSLGMGPHCDDEITGGQPSHNGYPWECPRGEGYQAFVDPYAWGGAANKELYIPIGLFNRFDLTPADGSHCGEYRIAFAQNDKHPDFRGRNYIIFEAVMPNPKPELGLQGCLPVAEFWYKMSYIPDPGTRQKMLEEFYFKGIPGFPPAVHADHYGSRLSADGYGCSTGQIRTNQFINGDWNLREFRVVKDCRCNKCFLLVVPTTVKDNPFGELWNGFSGHPNAGALHTTALNSVWSLGVGSVNHVGWSVDNRLNSGESVAVPGGVYDYTQQYNFGAGSPFFFDLAAEVNTVWGPTYNANHITDAAVSQSCAGCHHTAVFRDIAPGVTWPPSLDFVHVSEFIGSASAYPLSDAMWKFFLPHRAKLLEDFIASGGSAAPTDNKCGFRLPPELVVECQKEKGMSIKEILLTRSFKSSGLEALKRPLPRDGTLGGSRTH